jgi:uncharacterized protein YtpQ (UPF0354 family)
MRKPHLQAILLATLAFSSAALACDLTVRQLQQQALSMLQKDYPQHTFSAGSAENVIQMGKAELGLDNLHSKLCSEGLTPKQREKQIRKHFANIVAMVEEQQAQQEVTWDVAKEMVSLQLAPRDYLQRFIDQTQLVHRQFTTSILLAVVLDGADAYGYVGLDDRKRWKISEDELFAQAQRNLERSAEEVRIHGGKGVDKLLAIQENDGYDAARILVPAVRQQAAKVLGEPFLVGIPHRDFLVMWSTENSAEFQRSTRETIRNDYAKEPYAISGGVFKLWADGRIQPAE